MDFENDYIYRLELVFDEDDVLVYNIISPDDDEVIKNIEDDLYSKYLHKESDRSKYKFTKLWTFEAGIKIAVIANTAINRKYALN
jgi:hypothetical protein